MNDSLYITIWMFRFIFIAIIVLLNIIWSKLIYVFFLFMFKKANMQLLDIIIFFASMQINF